MSITEAPTVASWPVPSPGDFGASVVLVPVVGFGLARPVCAGLRTPLGMPFSAPAASLPLAGLAVPLCCEDLSSSRPGLGFFQLRPLLLESVTAFLVLLSLAGDAGLFRTGLGLSTEEELLTPFALVEAWLVPASFVAFLLFAREGPGEMDP